MARIDRNSSPLSVEGQSLGFEAFTTKSTPPWGESKTTSAAPQAELGLGVEQDIVVKMSPLARTHVRIRAKYLGRAQPRIVLDTVVED